MTQLVATESLVRLRGKYQRMLEMRRAHDRGAEEDPREQMRELAAEFPGALREIDELPLSVIEQRIQALTEVIEQRQVHAPWMAWMVSYHGHLRAALRIKRMALLRHDLDAALETLHQVYVARDDEPPVASFTRGTLADVLKPATGRLNDWVFARIAADTGVSVDVVRDQLFPARRPPH